MAVDFMICVRNVSRGAFGDEPGRARLLVVPDGQDPSPEHVVGQTKKWFEAVIEESMHDSASGGNPAEGDALVFIHGYNNDQRIVMQRHRKLRANMEALGYQGTVISFDWPSADSALNYLEDRSDAKATALHLVTDCILPLSKYQQTDCWTNVHVLAHSTGAFVVREAFDDADDRPRIAGVNWTASQVMLIGADISQKSMTAGNAKCSSLFRHSVRITNYSNPHDAALKLSNIKRVGVVPRVGRVGLPAEAPGNCVNVDCGPYWETLDESSADFFGSFSHSWHIGDRLFTRDVLSTIQGDIDRHCIPTRKMEDGRLVLHPPA